MTERSAPQIGVDADRGHLAGGDVGLPPLILGPAAERTVDVVLDELAAGQRDGAGSREDEGGYAGHDGIPKESWSLRCVIERRAQAASSSCDTRFVETRRMFGASCLHPLHVRARRPVGMVQQNGTNRARRTTLSGKVG